MSKRVTRSQTRAVSTDLASTPPDPHSTYPSTASSTDEPIDLTSSPPSQHDTQLSSPPAPSRPAKQSNKRNRSYFDQTPRRITHARLQSQPPNPHSRRFDYSLDYRSLDLRAQPQLYRVGVGEQGVLLCQPYKAEILPLWRFKTVQQARDSSTAIEQLCHAYRQQADFVGQDLCRKFLQMGYTRSRRYANHKDGRKYDSEGRVRALEVDEEKAECAEIFRVVWKRVEADEQYQKEKAEWKRKYG